MNNPVKDQTTPSPSLPSTVLMGNKMRTHTNESTYRTKWQWYSLVTTIHDCIYLWGKIKGRRGQQMWMWRKKKHVDVAITDNAD